MKAHAFGDLNELNLEPYVTLRALPASSLGSYPTLKHKIRQNLVKQGQHILVWRAHPLTQKQTIPNQSICEVMEHQERSARLKGLGWPEQGPTVTTTTPPRP